MSHAEDVIKKELDQAAGFGTGNWAARVLDALDAAGFTLTPGPSRVHPTRT